MFANDSIKYSLINKLFEPFSDLDESNLSNLRQWNFKYKNTKDAFERKFKVNLYNRFVEAQFTRKFNKNLYYDILLSNIYAELKLSN